ncbi:F-box domain-containing protein, partial [Haematococcus lacustris]
PPHPTPPTMNQGWQLAVQLLQWLKDHHNPRSVSGSLHRAELQLALRYMGLCTDNTCDKGR